MERRGEHRYKGCLRNKSSFFPSREIRLEGWLANFRPDSQELGETDLRLLTRFLGGPSAQVEDFLQQHLGAGAQGKTSRWLAWSRVELVRCAEGKKTGGGNTKEAAFQGTDHCLRREAGLGWKRAAENLAEGVNPEEGSN